MKQLHFLSFAAGIAMAALPAIAQQAASAPMPAMAASMPVDCVKASMKRHDHGAERGAGVIAGSRKGAPCPPDGAASATVKKAKKKPLHDHAKFNKNQ